MTARSILIAQSRHIIDRMNETDPASDDYSTLLANLERELSIAQFVADCLDGDGAEPEPSAAVPTLIPLHMVHPATDPFPEAVPESAPAVAETAAVTETAYTKEEVRAALGKARLNGANVTEILKRFGVDRFPAFPANRYGELMDELKEYS